MQTTLFNNLETVDKTIYKDQILTKNAVSIFNTKILPSSIHGLGLFAARKIKKGEEIIQAEKANLNTDLSKWIEYAKSGNRKSFAYTYGYCLVNHSENPNTTRGRDFEILANKDIDTGEEITEDYNLLPDEENPFNNIIEHDIFNARCT